jgi:hypothetical protein
MSHEDITLCAPAGPWPPSSVSVKERVARAKPVGSYRAAIIWLPVHAVGWSVARPSRARQRLRRLDTAGAAGVAGELLGGGKPSDVADLERDDDAQREPDPGIVVSS